MGWEADAFHAALGQEAVSLESLAIDPVEYTTRGGQQAGRIMEGSPEAIAALIDLLRREVERHAATLPCGDPVGRHTPRDPSLEAWAVILDRGGRQLPHFHPAGWLSGVYYAAGADRVEKMREFCGLVFHRRLARPCLGPQGISSPSRANLSCFRPGCGMTHCPSKGARRE